VLCSSRRIGRAGWLADVDGAAPGRCRPAQLRSPSDCHGRRKIGRASCCASPPPAVGREHARGGCGCGCGQANQPPGMLNELWLCTRPGAASSDPRAAPMDGARGLVRGGFPPLRTHGTLAADLRGSTVQVCDGDAGGASGKAEQYTCAVKAAPHLEKVLGGLAKPAEANGWRRLSLPQRCAEPVPEIASCGMQSGRARAPPPPAPAGRGSPVSLAQVQGAEVRVERLVDLRAGARWV
jgi:hypothetical protein